jgi:hypothetical protein
MNGDYEDALVRLLAGEGGYLILDSEPALRDLRAELESAHPNTGIYREFAAVDVLLNQAYLDLSASAMDQLPDLVQELDADDPVSMAALAPAEGNAGLGIVPPGADIFSDSPANPETSSADPAGAEPAPYRPPLAPEFVEDEASQPPAAPASVGSCGSCGGRLPDRADLNFCPFCGADLRVVLCAGCGATLEPEWSFCPSCGTKASG